jgi:MFS family permease
VQTGLPLWRRRAFATFWLGESISFLGSRVTDLALPLTAVLLLGASADQMGILTAAGYLPFLVVGLLAGVWVDRFRRRRILIVSDIVSAAAVMTVPVAWSLGWLRIEQLYVVGFVLGFISVIWTVAYQSFVPTLVGREDLVEGNAKLEATNSIGLIVGPSGAGTLVQLVGAPIALLADAGSFLVSAALLGSIRVTEPPPLPESEGSRTTDQIREGIRLVLGTPILAALVRCGATHNLFSRMIEALFVLYATRDLGLSPLVLGLVYAAGGPGALIGSLVAQRLADRLGVGRVIVLMQALTGVARLLIPLAGGPVWLTIAVLMASDFLLGMARTVFNVTQVSLRLSITPDRLHGRVNATMRFIMWAVTPVGALVGGFLGASLLGIRTTLLIAAIGVSLATLPVLVSPLRNLRTAPAPTPTS